MKTTLNVSCSSHASIIVFLTSCGLDVDRNTIINCKTCVIKVVYIAPTETGKW